MMQGQMGLFDWSPPPPAPPGPVPVLDRVPSTPGKVLDSMCLLVTGKNMSGAVSWWLMASYLYYHHDIPLISDGLYDELAAGMLNSWDGIEHPHKHLITLADLEAGSLYALPVDAYPKMVKYAAANLARAELGISIHVQ
jgi:hypothetical protein